MADNSLRERNWMIGGYPLIIPAQLRVEWHLGLVTAEQVLFLAEIESFVQHGKYNKYGIWPSNAKLAKKQNCSIRRIQQILSELSAKGYLIITYREERRYIKTCWSHVIREAFIKKGRKQTRKRRPDTP